MPVTKTDLTFQASATNTAGSTATGTGIDLSAGYGASINVRITNGGTGPTVACRCDIEVSNDNTDYYLYRTIYGSTANSAVVEQGVDIPMAHQFARTVFTGNTAQSVTVEADGSHVTAVA
ncbi:MAG: hypothetical protein JKX85_06175 [Phycisphaeraceae bacterium]|nr:hypothetical protein [Phycisphaeraceae bacterium]